MTGSTSWEAVCEIVRSEGGVIDNARPGRGPRGLGLFAIDAGAPVRLMLPRALLVPVEAVVLRGGALDLTETAGMGAAIGAAARALFRAHYGGLGFSPDVQREGRRQIAGRARLPAEVQKMVLSGNPLGLERFAEASDTSLLEWFLETRAIKDPAPADGAAQRYLMPVMDMLNHDHRAAPFTSRDGGVEVAGTFPDEVLARYHDGDCWSIYSQWGFVAASDRAFSLGLTMTEPAGWSIRILADTRSQAGMEPTRVRAQGRVLTIERMLLSGPGGAEQARQTFLTQVGPFGLADPKELFALVTRINKDWFNRLIALGKGARANSVLAETRAAAKVQVARLAGV